jgi:integrase/recombinase XerD
MKVEGLTIVKAFEEFVTACKIKNLSNQTITYYELTMKKFETFLFSRDIFKASEITLQAIEDYTIYLKGQPNLNDVSVNSALRGVRSFVYYLQGQNYCSKFKIKLMKIDKAIKQAYTETELIRLLEKPQMDKFSEYRDWVIVNFLLTTGVRLGELLNIKICDIDLQEAIVKIVKGKSRRERHIPLSKSIVKILMEYLSIRQGLKDDYLFPNSYGLKLGEDSLKHSISRYNKKRGVDKTSCHLFRHTFAKNYLLNGGDVFRLQKILGHASLDVTREYLQMNIEDLKQDFDAFNPLENIGKKKGCYIRPKI